MALDTPSGMDMTALDKFVLHYTSQGYQWTDRLRVHYLGDVTKKVKNIKEHTIEHTKSDSDIIFYKRDSDDVLIANAEFGAGEKKNYIIGFNIRRV